MMFRRKEWLRPVKFCQARNPFDPVAIYQMFWAQKFWEKRGHEIFKNKTKANLIVNFERTFVTKI